MKIFRSKDYIDLENPTPGESYRPEILTAEHRASNMGGMLGVLPPGGQVPYHFHSIRESVIIFIAGEGIEIVEGQEFSVRAGDILFIPAGEKHMTLNRSNQDLRYLEFFTNPPVKNDFIAVTSE